MYTFVTDNRRFLAYPTPMDAAMSGWRWTLVAGNGETHPMHEVTAMPAASRAVVAEAVDTAAFMAKLSRERAIAAAAQPKEDVSRLTVPAMARVEDLE